MRTIDVVIERPKDSEGIDLLTESQVMAKRKQATLASVGFDVLSNANSRGTVFWRDRSHDA
jgi:hypothetical protein